MTTGRTLELPPITRLADVAEIGPDIVPLSAADQAARNTAVHLTDQLINWLRRGLSTSTPGIASHGGRVRWVRSQFGRMLLRDLRTLQRGQVRRAEGLMIFRLFPAVLNIQRYLFVAWSGSYAQAGLEAHLMSNDAGALRRALTRAMFADVTPEDVTALLLVARNIRGSAWAADPLAAALQLVRRPAAYWSVYQRASSETLQNVFANFAAIHAASEQAAEYVLDVVNRTFREGGERVTAKLIVETLSRTQFRSAAQARLDPYWRMVVRTNTQLTKQFARFTAGFRDPQTDAFVYLTVGDAAVRESHAQLHGFTAPKESPDWARLTPPLDYNCRCYLVPVRGRVYDAIRTAQPGEFQGAGLTPAQAIHIIDEAMKGRPARFRFRPRHADTIAAAGVAGAIAAWARPVVPDKETAQAILRLLERSDPQALALAIARIITSNMQLPAPEQPPLPIQ